MRLHQAALGAVEQVARQQCHDPGHRRMVFCETVPLEMMPFVQSLPAVLHSSVSNAKKGVFRENAEDEKDGVNHCREVRQNEFPALDEDRSHTYLRRP